MTVPNDGPEPIERASAEELRALQLSRLQATLARVYERVPRYKGKFDAAGVKPGDLRSLADLAAFPFTTKDDLRDGYPFGLFTVPTAEIVRIHASSGTTGKPTVVGYTKGDIDTWSGLLARSLRASGVRPGDKLHNAFGYGLFTGGLGWHYGAERLGATVVPVSGGATERQVMLIDDFRPDVLLVTPSYALVIADAFEAMGLDPAASSLRLLIGGAEPWSEGLRVEIERRFGVDAYDSYGLSEVIGPGVAQECAGDKGHLTVWEDHFLIEIVDPETGAVLPEGATGEAVFTTLTKEGMPVVRYRSRDLTRFLSPSGGRPMRRIERVMRRSDDTLVIRGVTVYPSQIEAILTGDPRLSAHYVVEVRRGAGRRDELTVRVETRPETAEAADSSVIGRHAEHLIKTHAGVTVRVEVVDPGTIERSQGKATRVIDLRPKEPS